MKTAVNKKETGKSLDDTYLDDTYLDDANGGRNTVNFIHGGKTTCTLVVEGKGVELEGGNLKDVPKDIFITVMTTEDNLKFSKEEAEEIYKKYTA